MGNGSGVSPGDRNRNARLERRVQVGGDTGHQSLAA
jgi:hypothetical protein